MKRIKNAVFSADKYGENPRQLFHPFKKVPPYRQTHT
jgi:hypothetical protein